MNSEYIEKLQPLLSKHEWKICSRSAETIEIINPFQDENISLCLWEDDLMFYFSFQHRHFDSDIAGLIQCAFDFINEKRVAIEFFRNGNASCGSDLDAGEVDFSSPISIAKCMYPELEITQNWFIEQFKIDSYSFKVRSWSGKKDLDGDILWDGNAFHVNLQRQLR